MRGIERFRGIGLLGVCVAFGSVRRRPGRGGGRGEGLTPCVAGVVQWLDVLTLNVL